jgi:hypothetical protein
MESTRPSPEAVPSSVGVPSLGFLRLPVDVIFQFLSLRQCLIYTCVSRGGLEEMLPELERRRTVQFLRRHREEAVSVVVEDDNDDDEEEEEGDEEEGDSQSVTRPSRIMVLTRRVRLSPCPESPGPSTAAAARTTDLTAQMHGGIETPFLQPLLELHDLYSEERITCLLPSVKERVEALYRAIPASHPFNGDLRRLVLDLQQQRHPTSPSSSCDMSICSSGRDESPSRGNATAGLIDVLHQVMAAHRLHSSLLARSTVRLAPVQVPQSIRTSTATATPPADNDPNEVSVTLDQYMGDVLSAYCLSGHSIAGLVEGGPSFAAWIDHLAAMLTDAPIHDAEAGGGAASGCAIHWYHVYVYLHSSALRSIPYPAGGRDFGLAPPVGYLVPIYGPPGGYGSDAPGAARQLVLPPCAFRQTHVTGLAGPDTRQKRLRALRRLVRLVWARCDRPPGVRTGTHRTLLSNFGPLGPAFRGRDRRTTEGMEVRECLAFLVGRDDAGGDVPGTGAEPVGTVQSWMVRLQEQLRNARPMTVLPPMVVICASEAS